MSIADSISKWFDLLDKDVFFFIYILMASRPLYVAVIPPSLMLDLDQVLLVIMIACGIP